MDKAIADLGEAAHAHEHADGAAERAELGEGKSAPARVAALTRVTLEARSRWVSEMPAYAAAASGEGIPGTTSNGTPAAARCSASSEPRPKRKGSPPLSRTTLRPARARCDQGLIDGALARLLGAGIASPLADVAHLGVGAHPIEQRRVDQLVVKDDIGARQQLGAAQGEQPRIAGAAPDEVNDARTGGKNGGGAVCVHERTFSSQLDTLRQVARFSSDSFFA